MSRRTFRQRGIAYLSAGLAVLGLGLVAALVLNTGAAPAQARVELDNALMVSTRTQLRVCVQPASTVRTDASQLVNRVATQLDHAKRHPDWAGAFGRLERTADSVTVGCPGGSLPSEAVTKGMVVGPGLTDDPSPFRTWIWVLDDATADRLLGPDRDSAVVSAERMADGDQIVTVSTSLLVRDGRLADVARTGGDFAGALGLRMLGKDGPVGPASHK